MTATAAAASDTRVKILLIDDQSANLQTLESILQDLGQELVTARKAQDALRHLRDDDFAVVLLDLEMPGLNGFDMAKLVRNLERSRQTPIIFLAATEGSDFPVVKAYELGAVDYLHKLQPEAKAEAA